MSLKGRKVSLKGKKVSLDGIWVWYSGKLGESERGKPSFYSQP
nr:hypothetical protein [Providencia rettgeri]URQ57307.1 Hypothetical protein [Providencia alcalifaciens]